MILSAEDLHTYYGSSHVLQGVSLRVGSGELVTLLGRNGAGKTTLLRSLVGLTRARAGVVGVDRRDVRKAPTHTIARLGIAFVPSGRRVFGSLTVDQNLQLAARSARRRKGTWNVKRVYETFPALAELRGRPSRHLSGGEQQMLKLGRALVTNPEILLLDEPTEGLAPVIVGQLGTWLELLRREGFGVLLAEQNATFAMRHADRGYILEKGLIRHEGTAAELSSSEELLAGLGVRRRITRPATACHVSTTNGNAPVSGRWVEGRTALVTGAASGIGLATARRLASSGARVVLSDRPGDGLDTVAAELDGATAVAADLCERDDVARLVAQAGPVQILVNNAGLQHVSPVEDFPEEAWDRLLAVMLTAPFLLAKAYLPSMYDGGWGRVINIASVHGLVASPYKSAYVAAKHGLVGLTKTIALEAAARCPDVTAHAICPSYVRTPLIEAQVADQALAHGIDEESVLGDVLLSSNAVKRLIEPDEVALAVEFLCSPAAWAMTGSVLPMDAGWLAH